MGQRGDEAGQRLKLLCDVFVLMVRQEAPDFTRRQLALLLTCYSEAQSRPIGELAQTLGVSRPAMSQIVDRLEDLGLVERRESRPGDDQRVTRVGTTDKGWAFMEQFREIVREAAKSME